MGNYVPLYELSGFTLLDPGVFNLLPKAAPIALVRFLLPMLGSKGVDYDCCKVFPNY